MRPHDARSARRQAADARRKIRIQTTWLPGFPVDGAWQPFGVTPGPDPQPLVIGPEEIRRAERAPVDLPRDLADRVVDDGWAEALLWIVGRAKAKNLGGSAAERYRPSARKALASAPGPLADAISWWRLFSPSDVPKDLEAVTHPAFAEVLARHELLLAMRLLRAQRAVGIDEILGWLGDPRSYRAPFDAIVGDDLPARRSSARASPSVAAWWVSRVSPAKSDQLGLLAAVAPGSAVRDEWLADRDGYMERLERIGRCEIPRADESPPKTRAFPALKLLDGEHTAAFARAITALPDHPQLPRLVLAALVKRDEIMERAVLSLAAPFPWLSLAEHLSNWRVHNALLYADNPAQIAALLSEPCTVEDVDRADDAVRVAGPAAAALLAALPANVPVHASGHAFAVSITQDRAALARLVAAMPSDFPSRSSKTLATAGVEALTAWFVDHHGGRLEQLAALEPLAGRPIPEPPPLTPTRWWDDLPAAFHPAAEALSRVDDDADGTTRRILRAVVPDPAAIRDELAWIDDQPATHERAESLAKRRAFLVRLRASPPTLGPKRVENLVADLQRTAREKRLDRWERHAREIVAPILRDRLGVSGDISVLFDPRYHRVVGGFSALDKAFRRLFGRVVQVRLGPPPWDLADPANDRLADRFRALGLDLLPWNSRELVREGRMPEGTTFRVQLEPDPLEVLRMGEHFGTCLSPGSMNWFSAVANAADWHRQVAFARDADGTVLGRVLICITEQGGLLSFSLYAHRHEAALEQAMAGFVQDLAAAMGTAVVARGKVPLALAPRWYDDGPDDRTCAWPALEQSSDFRLGLGTLAPEALHGWITAAFSPTPPTPLLLGWLTALPEVYGRPELLRALVPDAEALSDDDPAKIDLYRRLYEAGDKDLVATWARTRAAAALRTRWREPAVDWLFDLALEEFPWKILHWVRDLSSCAGCGFEYEAFAAFQAARACNRLHRLNDARRLRAFAVGPDVHSHLPQRFEEAAKQLPE